MYYSSPVSPSFGWFWWDFQEKSQMSYIFDLSITYFEFGNGSGSPIFGFLRYFEMKFMGEISSKVLKNQWNIDLINRIVWTLFILWWFWEYCHRISVPVVPLKGRFQKIMHCDSTAQNSCFFTQKWIRIHIMSWNIMWLWPFLDTRWQVPIGLKLPILESFLPLSYADLKFIIFHTELNWYHLITFFCFMLLRLNQFRAEKLSHHPFNGYLKIQMSKKFGKVDQQIKGYPAVKNLIQILSTRWR